MVHELIKDSRNFINPKSMLEVMLHVPSKIPSLGDFIAYLQIIASIHKHEYNFIHSTLTIYIVFQNMSNMLGIQCIYRCFQSYCLTTFENIRKYLCLKAFNMFSNFSSLIVNLAFLSVSLKRFFSISSCNCL